MLFWEEMGFQGEPLLPREWRESPRKWNQAIGRSCAETHWTTHIKTNIRSITDGRNGKSQNHIWKSSCFICCLFEARSRLVSQAETEPTLTLRAASDARVILVPQPPKCWDNKHEPTQTVASVPPRLSVADIKSHVDTCRDCKDFRDASQGLGDLGWCRIYSLFQSSWDGYRNLTCWSQKSI